MRRALIAGTLAAALAPGPASAEPAAEPEQAAEPAPAAKPAPEPGPAAGPAPEPEAAAEPVPEPEAAAEPVPEPEAAAEPAPGPVAAADPPVAAPAVVDDDADELEISGRLFVRESYTTLEILGDRVHRHERTVDSARFQIDYRRKDYLRAVIEADIGDGDLDVKDAYIRVQPSRALRFEAGRFKQPMSVIALDSKWDLPATERGLLSTLEIDGEDLPFSGGRGIGVSARVRAPGAWKPTATAALFQNPLGSAEGGLDASEHVAQDAYLRVSVEPVDGLELASSLAFLGHLDQPGQLDSFEHAPIASLEGRLDFDRLQVWAEGYLGNGLFAGDAPFWAARAIVAPVFERRGWPKRLEPFATGSIFDPDTDAGDDRNAELGGGLDLAFTKYLRLTADVVHRFAEGAAAPAIAGTDARVQLGARFSN